MERLKVSHHRISTGVLVGEGHPRRELLNGHEGLSQGSVVPPLANGSDESLCEPGPGLGVCEKLVDEALLDSP